MMMTLMYLLGLHSIDWGMHVILNHEMNCLDLFWLACNRLRNEWNTAYWNEVWRLQAKLKRLNYKVPHNVILTMMYVKWTTIKLLL